MATLDNFLVAIDFSAESEAALEQAMAIAAGPGASLTLLWVDTRAPTHALAHAVPAEVDKMMASQYDQAHERLRALVARVEQRGLRARYRIESGHPDETIVATAEATGTDLVVTGTRGLTGLKRFFLGSVAEAVVRTCHTNVLVARGEPKAPSRILVATDFSPVSAKALTLALALAAPTAEIDLFHSWQYPTGTIGITNPTPRPGDPLASLRDQIVDSNQARGQALCQRAQAQAQPGQRIQFIQTYAPAAGGIHDRLDAHSYDLVATGTHGYRGFRRFMLGSVAEATVRHAPCSVLVVHAGDVEAASAGANDAESDTD